MWENNASPMLIGWPEYEADNIKKRHPDTCHFVLVHIRNESIALCQNNLIIRSNIWELSFSAVITRSSDLIKFNGIKNFLTIIIVCCKVK